MPRRNKGKDKASSKRGGKKDSVDLAIVAAHHAAARGDYLFDVADIGRRPSSMLLTQKPPKKVQDVLTWIQTSYVTSLTLPATGSILETNQIFSLNGIPLASAFAAVFDQYCIYSAMVRFTLENSFSTNPAVVSWGRITTAIDFDSGAAVGSEGALMGFSSAISSELIPGKSYERYVKPCITVLTGQGSSTSVSGVSPSRQWCDSAYTTIPHYGIRCICQGNLQPNNGVLNIFTSVVMGFRNNY